MEGFCRGCLIKYDDPDDLLEYTEKNRRLFIYSTGLQVKRNDVFTFQLCKDCYVNMYQSCRFKKLCRSSDKKFKTYLALKDAGGTQDLCTYLKNSDDSFSLRWAGNSTPAKLERDDDNESTCTSIRNFMQDMLQGTEMQDSEARIVRQVIEEEADVLDDSLDSHWLQDDVSIATDFRLDFSPFSTPRSMSYGNSYTPSRQTGQTPDANRFDLLEKLYKTPKLERFDNDERETENENRVDDVLSDSILDNSFGENFDNNVKTRNVYDETEIVKIENDLVDPLNDGIVNKVNSKNYYVDHTLVEHNAVLAPNKIMDEKPDSYVEFPALHGFVAHNGELIEQPRTFLDEPETFVKQQLIFDGKDMRVVGSEGTNEDRNKIASKTLRNNENDEDYSLKYILGTPSVYPNQDESGLTPTINNILFGEKLEDSQDQFRFTTDNSVQKKNVYADLVKMEPLISPLSMATDHIDLTDAKTLQEENDLILKNNKNEKSGKATQIKKEMCEICDKKFKDIRALKIHSAIVHFIKFPKQKRIRKNDSVLRICDYCGKEYTDRRNFAQHIARHMKSKLAMESTQLRNKTRDRILEAKRRASRIRHEKIKKDPKLSALRKAQQKENYAKKKREKRVVSIKDKNVDEQQKQRQKWRENSKMYYRKNKQTKEVLQVNIGEEEEERELIDLSAGNDEDPLMTSHLALQDTKNKKVPKECEICGFKLSSESKYRLHMNAHRGIRLEDASKKLATCNICNVSMRQSSLARHVSRHARRYTLACEVCGRGYYTRADYTDHMRTHTGERPYVCGTCGRDFKRRNTFIRHTMMHKKELRFICDNCNTGFRNKTTLIRHIAHGSCKDFKTTGKFNKIKRTRRNEVIIYKVEMDENQEDLQLFSNVTCYNIEQ